MRTASICSSGDGWSLVPHRVIGGFELPDGKLVLIWDGAPYHRAKAVQAAAAELGIELAPLPG